jgi:hypothetical protein
MAARARAKDEGGSSTGAVAISRWSACATRSIMLLIDLAPPVHRFHHHLPRHYRVAQSANILASSRKTSLLPLG